jgi:hypothetical protein
MKLENFTGHDISDSSGDWQSQHEREGKLQEQKEKDATPEKRRHDTSARGLELCWEVAVVQ